MEIISSRQNKNVSDLIALKEKRNREKDRRFAIDGRKLFLEAKLSNANILSVFCSETYYLTYQEELKDENVTIFTDELFEKVSSENAPQGIICVLSYLDNIHFSEKDIIPNTNTFFCVNIQDPGNLGTIIRSSYAMNCQCLVLCGNCADIYNPKVVRATMGTLFRHNIVIVADEQLAIMEAKKSGYVLHAAALDRNAKPLSEFKITNKDCFVVGNEGHGLSKEIIQQCENTVFIPMVENAESLNVSQASAILLWEKSKTIAK